MVRRNGHQASLGGVTKVPMTSFLADQKPTIIFN